MTSGRTEFRRIAKGLMVYTDEDLLTFPVNRFLRGEVFSLF